MPAEGSGGSHGRHRHRGRNTRRACAPSSPAERCVIAADSGLDAARALGLTVDLLVGDLDSVSPTGLAIAESAGTAVERHPPAKDATDAELAIDAALRQGCGHLIGVSGGPRADDPRLDHELGGLLAFARPDLGAVRSSCGGGRRTWGCCTVRLPRRCAGGPVTSCPSCPSTAPHPASSPRVSASPSTGGAASGQQPGREQRRRARRRRCASRSAPSSSSIPHRLELRHDQTPSAACCAVVITSAAVMVACGATGRATREPAPKVQARRPA